MQKLLATHKKSFLYLERPLSLVFIAKAAPASRARPHFICTNRLQPPNITPGLSCIFSALQGAVVGAGQP